MNKIPSLPQGSHAAFFRLFPRKAIPWFIAAILLIGIFTATFMMANKEENALPPRTYTNKSLPDTELVRTGSKAGNNTADAKATTLDTALYHLKLTHVTNGDSSGLWPVKTDYPLPGAIFPFKRVIAFYGNLYSKRMGILGELPPDQMMQKLQGEVEKWQEADPAVEVVPALHYIAVTAQTSPGRSGHYNLRMPFHQIDSVLNMASRINAIVFLDIQVGLSRLEEEIPKLEAYLRLPHVHLGIDPEFSMKTGVAPGKAVGSFDAEDINYASKYLAALVRDNQLPPKILVVHRFTQGMVTGYRQIQTRPEVQLVMHMDGWGGTAKKINTYKQYIHKEPVQFTGFKVFYKNDVKNRNRLLTPAELLQLKPQPVYIQYQ